MQTVLSLDILGKMAKNYHFHAACFHEGGKVGRSIATPIKKNPVDSFDMNLVI